MPLIISILTFYALQLTTCSYWIENQTRFWIGFAVLIELVYEEKGIQHFEM